MKQIELDKQDLNWAVKRLPKVLKDLMEDPEWQGKIFVGGGYLRSIVSGEPINDVDVFVSSKNDGELLAYKLAKEKSDVYTTDNAFTIRGKMTIQIIHRWLFDDAEGIIGSFDFTVCCAVIWCWDNKWNGSAHERFYTDLAAKRLIYQKPERNEDAGGSMLRVLKYYQKGYRIPLDSLGNVIARLIKGIDQDKVDMRDEASVARIITSLLVEVDPSIDPTHVAHLPSTVEEVKDN